MNIWCEELTPCWGSLKLSSFISWTHSNMDCYLSWTHTLWWPPPSIRWSGFYQPTPPPPPQQDCWPTGRSVCPSVIHCVSFCSLWFFWTVNLNIEDRENHLTGLILHNVCPVEVKGFCSDCFCRLLCSLCPGLSVLRAAVNVFGCRRVSGLWSGRSWVLQRCGWLLLLHGGSWRGSLYGGSMSSCIGLWDTGELLWFVRLLGDLSGVLLHLLPLIEQPQDSRRSEGWPRISSLLCFCLNCGLSSVEQDQIGRCITAASSWSGSFLQRHG